MLAKQTDPARVRHSRATVATRKSEEPLLLPEKTKNTTTLWVSSRSHSLVVDTSQHAYKNT